MMWAVTGIYFAFPTHVRRVVNALLPAGALTTGLLTAHVPGGQAGPGRAGPARPARTATAQIARVVVPSTPAGAYDVVMARAVHGDWTAATR